MLMKKKNENWSWKERKLLEHLLQKFPKFVVDRFTRKNSGLERRNDMASFKDLFTREIM